MTGIARRVGVLIGLAAILAAGKAEGQRTAASRAGTGRSAGSDNTGLVRSEAAGDTNRYTVVINLDENRLYFKQGDEILWSAPVGTGTGMRVITDDDDWRFNTPTGHFQVQFKERDPVWIAPDWYFVENNLPVPSPNHPSRYMKGTLGVAAIYISPDVAIHGTNRPDLIGQRVSHGCIRLENRYALRLYHNVQVGTEVVIVGGEEARRTARTVDLREKYDPSLASSGGRRINTTDPVLEGWSRLNTSALMSVLGRELRANRESSRWDEVAVMLTWRASQGDDEAMAEIFHRSVNAGSDATRREWATFAAYAYRSDPIRALEVLSGFPSDERQAVAGVLVNTALALDSGDPDSVTAPWPTRRLTEAVVPEKGRPGWMALVAAEDARREASRPASRPSGEIGDQSRRH
ncbi:MAG: L,D-transpeptidase [Gemmatimonadota bacterium]|nr:L,D-transpeptidase [Gemmatimonadota bacterium]